MRWNLTLNRLLFQLLAVSALSTTAAFAQSGEPAATDATQYSVTPDTEVPNDVRSDGAFRYQVVFDLPDYRGLLPKLGIRYNSNFKGFGSEESWLGVGWQLTGFSSIERASIGNGIPTFDDEFDLFRLDGAELMACTGNGSTNPWTGTYPDRYKTSEISASCMASGNFSTQFFDNG